MEESITYSDSENVKLAVTCKTGTSVTKMGELELVDAAMAIIVVL